MDLNVQTLVRTLSTICFVWRPSCAPECTPRQGMFYMLLIPISTFLFIVTQPLLHSARSQRFSKALNGTFPTSLCPSQTTSLFTSRQVFRRFWTPELLYPDSIVKCLWISIFKASLEVWNTLDYVLQWASPSPSQPSSLLRNTTWSPPLPFDLCIRC